MATHSVAVTQETLVSAEVSTFVKPGGAAPASDQVRPFHTPPSGPGLFPEKPAQPPTATQNIAVRQLIPDSWFDWYPSVCPPVGLDVLTIDHTEPFHCSTSGKTPVTPAQNPTAMHMLGEAQSMPFSRALPAPDGSGGASDDHAPPLQTSANGPWLVSPTATQLVWVGHDTPLSSPATEPTRAGADWIDQRCPLKRSTEGSPPTATHTPGTAHEIAEGS